MTRKKLNAKALFSVILSVCDTKSEDKICNSKNYRNIREKSDSLGRTVVLYAISRYSSSAEYLLNG